MVQRLHKIIVTAFFILSVAVLFSPQISPVTNITFAVLSLLIPLIVILSGLLIVYLLFRKSTLAILPFVVVVIFCFQYLPATIKFSSRPEKPAEKSFSVLSYNVSQFARPRNYYFDRFWKGDSLLSTTHQMIDFVVNHNAEIKCIQEFYTDSNSLVYNTKEKICRNGEFYAVQSTQVMRINKSQFGVAIFSKFPIINQGELIYSNNAFNRGVYADIKIDDDTIRIINVHLQSTQIGISLSKTFLRKWKYDQKRRAEQADLIVDFINKSPYRVILTGDFNATPYGYVYLRIARNLSNAYEEKGNGMSYTFAGKGIKYLRIDHQFFGKGIDAETFTTNHAVTYSDHYPIEGTYYLR